MNAWVYQFGMYITLSGQKRFASVNSGLQNYGHKTTDQADSITLMTIICRKDVEGFACTEYCASDLKHASLH